MGWSGWWAPIPARRHARRRHRQRRARGPRPTQPAGDRVGVLVTVRTMAGPVHSGMYGGAAPDALAALIALACATSRRHHGGRAAARTWRARTTPPWIVRRRPGVPGVTLLGSGSVADSAVGAPGATVLAIDAPSVEGVTAAIQHEARAVVNLRGPPGQDAVEAQRLLVRHLEGGAPWRVEVERKTLGQPFAAGTRGGASRRSRRGRRRRRPRRGARAERSRCATSSCAAHRTPRSCSSAWRSRPATPRATRASCGSLQAHRRRA